MQQTLDLCAIELVLCHHQFENAVDEKGLRKMFRTDGQRQLSIRRLTSLGIVLVNFKFLLFYIQIFVIWLKLDVRQYLSIPFPRPPVSFFSAPTVQSNTSPNHLEKESFFCQSTTRFIVFQRAKTVSTVEHRQVDFHMTDESSPTDPSVPKKVLATKKPPTSSNFGHEEHMIPKCDQPGAECATCGEKHSKRTKCTNSRKRAPSESSLVPKRLKTTVASAGESTSRSATPMSNLPTDFDSNADTENVEGTDDNSNEDLVNELEYYLVQVPAIEFETDQNGDRIRLGSGGFGNVYQGKWTKSSTQSKNVAIKVIDAYGGKKLSALTEEQLDKIYREIKILFQVDPDNNIIETYAWSKVEEAGKHKELHIAMKLMPRTLAQYVDSPECKNSTVESRIDLLIGIANGIKYLHTVPQVQHRDLKPQNILLDENNVPRISDFGLSKYEEETKTSRHMAGTPMYKDPAVYTHPGFRDYKASDIYAFGIIMWNVLNCNMTPQIMEGQRPPVGFETQKEVRELMQKCWNGDPNHRPNASDVHRTLVDIFICRLGSLAQNTNYLGKAGCDTVVREMSRYINNQAMQRIGCMAIVNLTNLKFNNDENRKRLGQAGGCEAVVQAMNRYIRNADIQKFGCMAIGFLANNDENRKRLGQAGGYEVVVQAMNRYVDNADIQLQGCGAIFQLAFNNLGEDRCDAVVKAVVQAMTQHKGNADIQQFGCFAIYNLADENDKNLGKGGCEAVIQVILQARTHHKTNADIQEWARKAIRQLAANDENKNYLLEWLGIID